MSLAHAEDTSVDSAVDWMAFSHLNKNKKKVKEMFSL